MKIDITGIENDINLETARRAYHGTSFSPEKRGDAVVDGYISRLTKLAQFIEENAKDETQQAIAQEVFNGLRQTYLTKTNSWLGAQSRCISSMITGPANFPMRRWEKANNSERKHSDALWSLSNKMDKYALNSLNAALPKGVTGENTTENFKGFSVVRNKDEDRLQLIFDGKPGEEVRSLLKSKGFRWSPRFGAWQRQLTENAENTLKWIKEKLESDGT